MANNIDAAANRCALGIAYRRCWVATNMRFVVSIR
jgi:hypothetical protein